MSGAAPAKYGIRVSMFSRGKRKARSIKKHIQVESFDVLEGRRLMTVTPPAAAGPWNSVFLDEFDTLNSNVWTNARTWGNSNVASDGIFSPNDATVSNGVLTLSGQNQSGVGTDNRTHPLTSGMLQTSGIQGMSTSGFEFEYGYVEIRAKGNVGNGFWTAGYMLPVSHQDGYEIDILENKGINPNTYYGGYHDWRNGTWAWGSSPLSFDHSKDFHDYAVDWEPGSLTFYVDGQVVRSYTGGDVPSQPMYLILNLDSGPYAGNPSLALPNDAMTVESVGVWQHTADYFLEGQGVGDLANPAANQFGNASFEHENINVSAGPIYQYHPSDAYWLYSDSAGLAATGSGFNNTTAPDGNQVVFLQGTSAGAGQISQTLNVSTGGTYNVAFQAAERLNQTQPIAVSVDGTVIATITPASSSFSTYKTPNFGLTKGPHTISFTATNTSSDNTSFVDAMSLNNVPGVVTSTPPVLTATVQSSTIVDLSWTISSTAATAYPIEMSTDGVNYKFIGTAPAGATSYQVTGLAPNTNYDFEVVANFDSAPTLISQPVAVTTPAASITAPWTAADIGSPTLTGSSSYANGVYTITGSGKDIWNASDQFHFLSQPASGSTTIVAEVTSQLETSPWAKAGVMIRASSEANPAFVDVVQTPRNGVDMQWRDASGNLKWIAGPKISGNVSVKLVQAGDLFTGYASSDGTSWTTIGSVTIAMPSSVLAGLAVTSLNVNLLSTATFENVAVTTQVAPPAPTGLTVTSTTDTTASLTWNAASGTITGYTIAASTDGTHFNTVGTADAAATSFRVTNLQPSTAYTFEITANNGFGTSLPSNLAQGSTAPSTIVAPWTASDIGAPSLAGSSSFSYGVYTVTGSGNDIWNASDQFQYVSQPASGNTTIVATVTSQGNTNPWAKAGVMIRASSAANTAFVGVFQTPGNGVAMQWRDNSGQPNWTPGPRISGNAVIKLVRVGDVFTGFASNDGTSWTTIGSVTIAMPSSLLAGLAVTSHNTGLLSTATFESVAVSSIAAPSAPTSLVGSVASSTSVNLQWTIGSGGGAASGFTIEASTDGTNYNTVATAPAGAATYQVTGLVPATLYTFRVSATNAAGISTPSNTTTAATLAAALGTPPKGWTSADIGSPRIAGTTSYNAGTYTISGNGLDIWGQSDQFRFVSRQNVGNATITARVTSQTNTGNTAKAGVMFRASNAANAAYVDLVQTPGGGVRLQWRNVTPGAKPQMIIGGTYANPVWLQLNRSGQQFTAFVSTDGLQYSQIGTVTVALPVESLVGLAASSFNANSASTATFDNVSLQASNAWMSSDIGSPAIAGSATFSPDLGSITLTGSGTGIRGTSDQFQYADQMTTGNVTVSAEVMSQTGTNGWAKSGVMIRASSDPGSAYVAVTQTVGNGLSFEWRTASGATEKYLENLPVVHGAVYIKLVRAGNTFVGYYSTDGVKFSQLGSVTINMGTNTFSGVATTSHDVTTANTAVFTNVRVSKTS